MCLILLAHRAHPHFPLVLAANRDEAYARPAAPAAFWNDHPEIYGGRDLERGGTWLAMTRAGKIAAVKIGRASCRERGERGGVAGRGESRRTGSKRSRRH